MKLKIRKSSTLLSHKNDVIKNEEFKFITDNFSFLMQNYTNIQYESNKMGTSESVDYDSIMKDRMDIFSKIFYKHRGSLNEDIDQTVYNSYSFIFGAEHKRIDNSFSCLTTSYNYYKDSNVSELLTCTDIMNEIEVKVVSQLQLYPDHATLNDVSVFINYKDLKSVFYTHENNCEGFI